MFSHGYIKNDFDVDEWARAGVPGAGGRGQVLKEEWAEPELDASCPTAAGFEVEGTRLG